MKDPKLNTNPNQDLFAMGFKRILCLDFDGVFHYYRQGWKGPTEIYDEPIPHSIEWLAMIARHVNDKGERVFDPQIYSSRSQHEGGIAAMQKWFLANGLPSDVLCELTFPTEKPAAFLTIDDRCFEFRGNFPTPEFILGYQSWIKEPRETLASVFNDIGFLRGIAETVGGPQGPIVSQRLRNIANRLEGRCAEDDNPYRKVG